MNRIGIMSAMQEEITSLLHTIKKPQVETIGGREFIAGTLWGVEVVAVFSRWGKVASASTVTTLLLTYNVKQVIFTGVAGAIDNNLQVGDVVIGDSFYQHDMDASPIFKKYEIPLVHATHFAASDYLNAQLKKAAESYFQSTNLSAALVAEFNLHKPTVHVGGIASGDQFVSNSDVVKRIKTDLPNVLCVEMEGAAVAQVCADFKIPFAVIRTISDKANDEAPIDFLKFIKEVASKYSVGVLRHYMALCNNGLPLV